MALIEQYHVVPDMYPVSPHTNPSIIEGMFVMLNSSGQAVKATGASGTLAIGVAGDSTVESTADNENNTHTQEGLVISSSGKKVNTSIRVSDPNHDETAASGKLTVYNAGGKYETDIFETVNLGSPITYVPGQALYVSANGKLTNVSSSNSQVVGVCTVAPREYGSGVPGTDTPEGDMSWGTYIQFLLKV